MFSESILTSYVIIINTHDFVFLNPSTPTFTQSFVIRLTYTYSKAELRYIGIVPSESSKII